MDDVKIEENQAPVGTPPLMVGGSVEAPRFTETPAAFSKEEVANIDQIGGREVPPKHPDIVTSNLPPANVDSSSQTPQISSASPTTSPNSADQIASEIRAPYSAAEASSIYKTEKSSDDSRGGLAGVVLRAVQKIFTKRTASRQPI